MSTNEVWNPGDTWDAVGVNVNCPACGLQKKPHGRSGPLGVSYCTADECKAYGADPMVGCLWPGEKASEFGFVCCTVGAEIGTEGDR